MMWVVKVFFEFEKQKQTSFGNLNLSKGHQSQRLRFRATGIHILQHDNASFTMAISNFESRVKSQKRVSMLQDAAQAQRMATQKKLAIQNAADDSDPLLVFLQKKKFSVADCLVDVKRGIAPFKTIEAQEEHFCKEMLLMSREGHDDEDGWSFFHRLEAEDVEVFQRKVEWSARFVTFFVANVALVTPCPAPDSRVFIRFSYFHSEQRAIAQPCFGCVRVAEGRR